MNNFIKLTTKPGMTEAGAARAGVDLMALAALARGGRDVVFVARDDLGLATAKQGLQFFAPGADVLAFPAWDCLPYDRVSPAPALASERISTLCGLLSPSQKPGHTGRIVLTTVAALLQRVVPRAALADARLAIKGGDTLAPEELEAFLIRTGHHKAHTVVEPGEFARRGGLVDIFPAGFEAPVRIDYFGDEVETIRTFDATDQRTTGTLEALELKPVSEVPMSEDAIRLFRTGYRELFGAVGKDDLLYEAVSAGQRPIGVEHWLPLFYEKMETLFDYLPACVLAFDHQAPEAMEARFDLIAEYFDARKAMMKQGVGGGRGKAKKNNFTADQPPYNPVPVARLYLSVGEVQSVHHTHTCIQFSPFAGTDGPGAVSLGSANLGSANLGSKAGRDFSGARVDPNQNVFDALKAHTDALAGKGYRVVIGAFSRGSGERLQTLLSEHGLETRWADNLGEVKDDSVYLGVLGFDNGFEWPSQKLAVISEPDILGERLSRPGPRRLRAENFIADVSTLGEGDFVVHAEHGIAQFDGLMRIKVGGADHECLRLIYAANDKLFLPVENIDAISRFGSEDAGAQLDRLGGAAWQARKAGMKKRLRDMAEELIKIAANREMRTASTMIADTNAFDEFQSRFQFEETEDQQRAILDVVDDLASGRPTDRLVCGDVGFGKTEVALRAAFVAALSGRQVALVVPTTLLARQHFNVFRERFQGFPVRIGQLSRLVTANDVSETKKGMIDGTVDIVIGTHALLAGDVGFRDLGLLIIDEEQHFGVKHKEKLKSLKADVHVLTLSATPIPRTLQLALSGVREMSLIATPPVDRLAVRTFVLPFDAVVVREAILRERFRGGQTFYVCPRIKDQGHLMKTLKELVPEVSVAMVNGQMNPKEMEATVGAFYEGQFDVLLATNIIESGLDLPKVNTIIIHRADMFGLAQLYQLRGRVGRSKTRAYAYLTLPTAQKLTPAAEKRLSVMQSLDSLGAGFQLASHDLDIRGAGNLLGEEQSGHIREVGIELYQQMLEEAVAEARGGGPQESDDWSPQVNVGLEVLIPETYVADLHLRMDLYRRASRLVDDKESEAFAAEMIDRFGSLPQAVENLLAVVSVKRLCKAAHIAKVDAGPKGAVVSFHENSFPNPAGLVEVISEHVGTIKLKTDHTLVIKRAWPEPQDRLSGVRRLGAELAAVAVVSNA